MSRKYTSTISHSEAKTARIPSDVLLMAEGTAAGGPIPFDPGSLARNAKIIELMSQNPGLNYCDAFSVVCLEKPLSDVIDSVSESSANGKRRPFTLGDVFRGK